MCLTYSRLWNVYVCIFVRDDSAAVQHAARHTGFFLFSVPLATGRPPSGHALADQTLRGDTPLCFSMAFLDIQPRNVTVLLTVPLSLSLTLSLSFSFSRCMVFFLPFFLLVVWLESKFENDRYTILYCLHLEAFSYTAGRRRNELKNKPKATVSEVLPCNTTCLPTRLSVGGFPRSGAVVQHAPRSPTINVTKKYSSDGEFFLAVRCYRTGLSKIIPG